MLGTISLADWLLLARNEQDQIAMARLTLHLSDKPYDDFIKLVDRALDFVIDEMTVDPSSKVAFSEDDLTEVVRLGLKCMGFNATHDTKTGGHTDLVIEELGKFRWLGEAKKIETIDNNHVHGGYLQLTTRYSNGKRDTAHGGMLVYSYISDTPRVLASWQSYLQSKQANLTVDPTSIHASTFVSTENLDSSGTPYVVKHRIVQLFHDPKK